MVNTQINDVIETYDGGIACTGTVKHVGDNSAHGYGFVKKLDVNGNTLWQKDFGMCPPPGLTYGYALSQTSDGGFILSAATNVYDGGGDLLILKLNACGEKEWERIFYDPGPQLVWPIYELEDGSFMTAVGQWQFDIDPLKRIWVFKLSPEGNTLWQKYFGYWNPPSTNSETGRDFIKSDDGNFVISGWGGVLEPEIDTLHWWTRPLFIKIDTAGNELWHHFILGMGEEFVRGSAYSGDTDSHGNIYCAGERNPPRRPYTYKVSSSGETIFHEDLTIESDSLLNGFGYDIQSMTDTTFYAFAGWITTSDSLLTYVFKLDSNGMVLDRKLLLDTVSPFWPMGSTTTHDNKYIAGSYNVVDGNRYSYLWKFQSNLEYDTLYTMPRVYDSLCPYTITDDTIRLDTTTVINLEYLWNNLKPMSIFPNPVSDKLNISINIVKWEERLLKVSNLSGTEVFNDKIPAGKAKHTIDVSTWKPGIYIFSLYEKGSLLQTEKVVKM
jgi:hypothetical protein